EIHRGLAEAQPAKMRLQIWNCHGAQVLDDSYNANADSMLAALQTLRDLPCVGRRAAVLGDMAELGEQSASAHAEVGKNAAQLGVKKLFAVGKMAAEIANGARQAGLKKIIELAEVDSAALAVKEFLKPGDLVLLKASRAMRLERVAEFLKK
ncbi:MAG: glutamate ligase domain-containing protein, partial [Limisphaerales bacterium]